MHSVTGTESAAGKEKTETKQAISTCEALHRRSVTRFEPFSKHIFIQQCIIALHECVASGPQTVSERPTPVRLSVTWKSGSNADMASKASSTSAMRGSESNVSAHGGG